MVHDSSSWTVISFSAEGQPEDISMMEILSTWLDDLLDNMCTRGKKHVSNTVVLINNTTAVTSSNTVTCSSPKWNTCELECMEHNSILECQKNRTTAAYHHIYIEAEVL